MVNWLFWDISGDLVGIRGLWSSFRLRFLEVDVGERDFWREVQLLDSRRVFDDFTCCVSTSALAVTVDVIVPVEVPV